MNFFNGNTSTCTCGNCGDSSEESNENPEPYFLGNSFQILQLSDSSSPYPFFKIEQVIFENIPVNKKCNFILDKNILKKITSSFKNCEENSFFRMHLCAFLSPNTITSPFYDSFNLNNISFSTDEDLKVFFV